MPQVTCAICNTRKGRRHCPGLNAAICAQCCVEAREETVDCPYACEHLLETRKPARKVDPSLLPSSDVKMSEEDIERLGYLMMTTATALMIEYKKNPRIVDADVREALDHVVRNYRTAQSGLVYESRPTNPFAAQVQDGLMAAATEVRQNMLEHYGMEITRDIDWLKAAVFFQQMAFLHDNGRSKGREFLHHIVRSAASAKPSAKPSVKQ